MLFKDDIIEICLDLERNRVILFSIQLQFLWNTLSNCHSWTKVSFLKNKHYIYIYICWLMNNHTNNIKLNIYYIKV